jgi:hypothetical protein
MKIIKIAAYFAAFASLAFTFEAHAQSTLPGWSEKKDARPTVVSFIAPEQLTVTANSPSWIELRFHIQDGFHINSHTPAFAELIPTVVSGADGSDVELLDESYPPGSELTMGQPPEKLNVYSGDFLIRTKIKSQSGAHLLKLKLRYQACTMNACMPPKTIPFTIGVQGN